MHAVLKDARRLRQAPLRRLKLVAYTCFMVSKWWWTSRANLEPKTNHTKGRWCTAATSQSMSAAASLGCRGEQSPEVECAVPSSWQPHAGCMTSMSRRTTGWGACPSYRPGDPLRTPARVTRHPASDTSPRTKTIFLPLCWSSWSWRALGHTGEGCPKPQGMQPVF